MDLKTFSAVALLFASLIVLSQAMNNREWGTRRSLRNMTFKERVTGTLLLIDCPDPTENYDSLPEDDDSDDNGGSPPPPPAPAPARSGGIGRWLSSKVKGGASSSKAKATTSTSKPMSTNKSLNIYRRVMREQLQKASQLCEDAFDLFKGEMTSGEIGMCVHAVNPQCRRIGGRNICAGLHPEREDVYITLEDCISNIKTDIY